MPKKPVAVTKTPKKTVYDKDVWFYHTKEENTCMLRRITFAIRIKGTKGYEYGATIFHNSKINGENESWDRKRHNKTAYERLKRAPVFISKSTYEDELKKIEKPTHRDKQVAIEKTIRPQLYTHGCKNKKVKKKC